MKIIVFGASGGPGIEIVKQALDHSHEVTAFVRNPAQVAIQPPKLKLVTGDIGLCWQRFRQPAFSRRWGGFCVEGIDRE
jgi:uncharacterized protein YbjT (DUF2867 family)